VEIPEYKRDESKDYKIIAESVKLIPFPVGRGLLADFLFGEFENKSIEKNKMFDIQNFGSLKFLGKEKIFEMIEELLENGSLKTTQSVFGKGTEVIEISENNKNIEKNLSENNETEITDEELKIFFRDLTTSRKRR
jgi:superfamily II DNA helicase RecQ